MQKTSPVLNILILYYTLHRPMHGRRLSVGPNYMMV